jgi:hypothetical protein
VRVDNYGHVCTEARRLVSIVFVVVDQAFLRFAPEQHSSYSPVESQIFTSTGTSK